MIDNDYAWLTWGVSRVPHGDLPPDMLARLAGQPVSPLGHVRPCRLDWVRDRTLRTRYTDHPRRLRADWRRWVAFRCRGQHVEIEAFGGIGHSPGFGFKDVRIYLDKVLAGRAWIGGCSLGFGGGSGPVVVRINDEVAMRVVLACRLDPGSDEVDLLG